MKTGSRGWTAIKFDKKFLNTLKKDATSGVELQKIQHHLALHPIHLHDLKKSVRDCLNEGLAKYNKTSGGIVLGYQNVNVLNDKGLIVNDSCYIHIDLLVEFFVFKPEVGKELRGVVNRKSKTHIGVLVYDIFNVSIPKPRDDENWLGSEINLGQEVVFSISQINLLSHLPYIGGQLISAVSHNNNNPSEINDVKRSSDLLTQEENLDEPSKKKHKKKDKRRIIEEEEIKVENNVEELEVIVNKRKKRKKSVISQDIEEQLSNTKTEVEDSVYEGEAPRKKMKIKAEPEEVQESDQALSWEEINYDLSFEEVTDKKILKELKKKKKQKHTQSFEESFSDFSLLNKVKSEDIHKKKSKKSRDKDKNNKNDEYKNDHIEESITNEDKIKSSKKKKKKKSKEKRKEDSTLSD